ncbi:MAG: NADH-quinone oxidoreductase subunit I, partial [Spirochaetia bacterium]|nr:NADH-quinone oxidoreductase subunit I [Spirochaetia bacterium]
MFKYILGIIQGIVSLCEGLMVTLKHVFRRPITVQYPEQREEMKLRFRGKLALPIDPEKNDNRCTACMMCVKACPNHSIDVEKMTGEDGKPKPKVSKFIYNMGSCMYCNLCVESCPFAAIIMTDDYETATADRSQLIQDLVAEKYVIKGK